MTAAGGVPIRGVGLHTALGHGRDAHLRAIVSGLPAAPATAGALTGGLSAPPPPARELFPDQGALIRRIDRLSRMIVASAGALRDELGGLPAQEEVAVAVGTEFGTTEETLKFLLRLRDKGPALANPMDFPNLVANAGAGYVGILLGLQGPSQTFCQHGCHGDDAIAWAAELVRDGGAQLAFAGAAEEWGGVLRAAHEAVRGPRWAPPGEGAALVGLGHAPSPALARWLCCWAERLPGPPMARWGRGPDPGPAIRAAVVAALRDLGARPSDLSFVVPSAGPAMIAMRAGLDGSDGDPPVLDVPRLAGDWSGDGALRIAIAALLLSNPSSSLGPGIERRPAPLAAVPTLARDGSMRVTLLSEPS